MGRGILAAVAGFAVWTLLWLVGNAFIRGVAPGAFREDLGTDNVIVLLAILTLSVAASLTAGWVTATVAPAAAMAAAFGLGVVNLAVGIGVQASAWELLPVWYHLTFLALLLPGVLVGARLRAGV